LRSLLLVVGGADVIAGAGVIAGADAVAVLIGSTIGAVGVADVAVGGVVVGGVAVLIGSTMLVRAGVVDTEKVF
jgi:hypothetical protein